MPVLTRKVTLFIIFTSIAPSSLAWWGTPWGGNPWGDDGGGGGCCPDDGYGRPWTIDPAYRPYQGYSRYSPYGGAYGTPYGYGAPYGTPYAAPVAPSAPAAAK